MRRVATAGFLLLTLLGPAVHAQYDDIAGQIRQTNYTNYVNEALHTRTGDNRGAFAPQHDAARETIARAFASFGLSVSLDPFPYQGGIYYNVTAVLPGKSRPGEYYVVGAHYDSVGNPGADDDATGIAALLEVARVASMRDFEASIVFVAFDREEAGLAGSYAWVAAHRADFVRGMIALDMIGYNPPGNGYNLIALMLPNTSPNATLPAIDAALRRYGAPVLPVYGGVSTRSDHFPFASLAPAVELIEASFNQNANYHRATDTVDTPGYIDYAYASAVSRAVAGYLADQAGLLAPDPAVPRLSSGGILGSASFIAGTVAPEEFVTLFGSAFNEAPSVQLRDSAGREQAATLVYASAGQLNILLPSGASPGPATITVTRNDGARAQAALDIGDIAPGVFTANSNGLGAPAAHVLRVAPDGPPTWADAFVCPSTPPSCSPAPIDFGAPTDRVFLVLYGTGIRNGTRAEAVGLEIGGQNLPVQYAGPQPSYPGLDQVNVELPPGLRGKGIVSATLRVQGKAANPVTIDLGAL